MFNVYRGGVTIEDIINHGSHQASFLAHIGRNGHYTSLLLGCIWESQAPRYAVSKRVPLTRNLGQATCVDV